MKKIFVTVKTNSQKVSVDKIDETHFKISVKEPPIEGKANKAVIEAVASFFDFPKSSIIIISGLRGKKKVLGILDRTGVRARNLKVV